MQKNKSKSATNFLPIRFGLLCVAILGCLGFLLARVGWLQIVSPDNLVKQEDMRSLREEPIDVMRGTISDREGRPLAVSVPVSAIWIDPQTMLEKGGVGYGPRWQAMAEALHIDLIDPLIGCSHIRMPDSSISRVRLIRNRRSGSINYTCRAFICAMNHAASIPPGTSRRTCWALPTWIIRDRGVEKALTNSSWEPRASAGA